MRRFALALVVALAGCGADFPNAALVDGLRLLGVQAEPPEAAPGQTVQLHAWVVDPSGAAIAVSWSACLLPPGGDGQLDPACITGDADKVALGDGSDPVVVVPDVDRAAFGPPDPTGGVYLPIVLRVTAAGGAVDGVYLLRLLGTEPPNHNPRIGEVYPLDPTTAQPVHAGDALALHPTFSGDSAELYDVPQPDGTLRSTKEIMTAQWFSTAGTFQDETSGSDVFEKFTLDRHLPPAGSTIDIWIVGHDERGGTTLAHRALLLQ